MERMAKVLSQLIDSPRKRSQLYTSQAVETIQSQKCQGESFTALFIGFAAGVCWHIIMAILHPSDQQQDHLGF